MSLDYKSGNLFKKIESQLRNVKYLEVFTAAGDPNAEIVDSDSLLTRSVVVVRTRIDLSTGKVLSVPQNQIDGPTSVNRYISNIHNDNVSVAILNWNLLKDALYDTIDFILNLWSS